jgi:hypothetical protein
MRERTLDVPVDPAPFKEPLRIAGRIFEGMPAVRVTISAGGLGGRGEAGGLFHRAGSSVRRLVGAIYRDGMIALPESFRGGR